MNTYLLVLPEIFLLSMICVIILVDLFVTQKQRILTYVLTQFTLVATAGITLWLFQQPEALIFNDSFVFDHIALTLKLFMLVISIFAFLYARSYINERAIPQGEYYILGLFSILGMLVLVSAYSFITLFLGLELLSLPLYAMVAISRESNEATEAAMKYFVLGSLATGLLLYGMSMVYGATHSLNINTISTTILATPKLQQYILIFGLVFIVAGLAFKLGAVPFHMWVPDVYQGAPNPVTLFIGSAPKIAALGMALRLLADTFPDISLQWQEMLIVIAVASIALGNIVAIVQTNLKRMLAYSAIAHMGYMSLGLLSADSAGYAAAMFYIIVYALMTAGAFGILVILSKNGIEAERISDLRGLNTRNPWLAFMMLLVMFSMAGIPPTVGFFAKLGVLEALIGVHMVWLATLALVFAIVGAYYYLNVVKVMYFEEPENTTKVIAPLDAQIAISVNGLAILALGIFPSALIHACRVAFALLL